MSPSPDSPSRPLAIAHRGWHKAHLENTMEAFRAAYAAGCDMVEFDVQLSRDGVPFIFHDDDGRRLGGPQKMVYETDWKDLREWVLPPRPGGQASGYRLPSLEDFLKEFGSKAFYLEMKVPKAKQKEPDYWQSLGEQCADLVKAASPRPETFLASFHPPILAHLASKEAYPNLVGIFETLERFREALNTRAPLQRYSLSWAVNRGYHKSAAPLIGPKVEAGQVIIWDIKSEKDMQAAKADGVYGLCADDVDTLVRMAKG